MKWILLRGDYYNPLNIERIKLSEDSIMFYYVHTSPTVFYNPTNKEKELLIKYLNNAG